MAKCDNPVGSISALFKYKPNAVISYWCYVVNLHLKDHWFLKILNYLFRSLHISFEFVGFLFGSWGNLVKRTEIKNLSVALDKSFKRWNAKAKERFVPLLLFWLQMGLSFFSNVFYTNIRSLFPSLVEALKSDVIHNCNLSCLTSSSRWRKQFPKIQRDEGMLQLQGQLHAYVLQQRGKQRFLNVTWGQFCS